VLHVEHRRGRPRRFGEGTRRVDVVLREQRGEQVDARERKAYS